MAGRNVSTAADPEGDAAFLSTLTGCRLCGGRLESQPGDPNQDDKGNSLCWSCKDRPEATRLKILPRTASSLDRRAAAHAPAGIAPPRPARVRPEFTAADTSLIRRLGPVLPVADLLRLLNERLEANNPEALPFTLLQLQDALPATIAPTAANDWAAVRKLLGHARASGLLSTITPQVLDDFAVIFSLTPAQVLRLKDVLSRAKDGK